MRTLVFCTSYASSQAVWNERWARWISAIRTSGLIFDEILIVDDGSPVQPEWLDVPIFPTGSGKLSPTNTTIHRFPDRRGRDVGGEPFPGWYRSFGYAVHFGIEHDFDRIIHVEADAFLISERAVEYFNHCDRGWVAPRCGTYGWPESTLQIINRDQFATCAAFFSKPYAAHLKEPRRPIELLLPFSHVETSLIGGRYGESRPDIPYAADYVSQVRWGQPNEYYWWMTEGGQRMHTPTTEHSRSALLDTYQVTDAKPGQHTGINYLQFMSFINNQMLPRNYLEIGTHRGASVSTMTCDAICIDPNLKVEGNATGSRKRTMFFQMPSDEFFRAHDPRALLGPIDLAFLDGLHLSEALLRDLINAERHSHSGTLTLLHDCLPINNRMTSRTQNTGNEQEPAEIRSFWTGDVWRVLPILQETRPDLSIFLIDCPPTGLVLITDLNRRSSDLAFRHAEMTRKYWSIDLDQYGLENLWSTFPLLSSRKIVAEPEVFCRFFGFRRTPAN